MNEFRTSEAINILTQEIAKTIKYTSIKTGIFTPEVVGNLTMTPLMYEQIISGERVPILREIVEIAETLNCKVEITFIPKGSLK